MKTPRRHVSIAAAVLCGLLLSFPLTARSQESEGEQLFKQICAACHTINGGKLVGPDLANVHERRPQDWILRFVKSSQSVIASGDEYAVALFEEFNKIPMPDNNLTDAQILSVIDYIILNSPTGESTDAPAQWPPHDVTEENIASGEELFVGKKRLENGGPSCISCHNINYDGVMSGGALAKDLTDSFSRLSGLGVTAMIRNSPFPAMNRAFINKTVTEEELFDLTAFLQHVSENESEAGRDYVGQLVMSGLGGMIFLLGLLSTVWIRAKKRTVNHSIYRRQVKSTWE